MWRSTRSLSSIYSSCCLRDGLSCAFFLLQGRNFLRLTNFCSSLPILIFLPQGLPSRTDRRHYLSFYSCFSRSCMRRSPGELPASLWGSPSRNIRFHCRCFCSLFISESSKFFFWQFQFKSLVY